MPIPIFDPSSARQCERKPLPGFLIGQIMKLHSKQTHRTEQRGTMRRGTRLLFIVQFGNNLVGSTVKEEGEKVGYVIGRHWLSMYAPYTKPAAF